MMPRSAVALLALAGLTGFAPAPFPRSGRRADATIDGNTMEGTWKIERLERTVGGKYLPGGTMATHIRIRDGRWTWVRDRAGTPVEMTSYRFALHADRKPAWIDGMRGTATVPYMVGIVRRRDDRVEVLYGFGITRPTTFAPPPPGCWRLTLRRDK